MPKKVGTENWRKKRRQEYLEMKEFRYYIFCEGEQTEPQYFRGFKRLIEDNPIYRDMVLIQIEPCGAENMRVIGQAEKEAVGTETSVAVETGDSLSGQGQSADDEGLRVCLQTQRTFH